MGRERGWGWVAFYGSLVGVAGLASLWACSSSSEPTTPSPDAGPGAETSIPVETGAEDSATGGTLGATCSVDANCATGLACWNATSDTRFPAHGICSKPCTDSTECAALKPGAVCFKLGAVPGDASWCGEPCTLGPSQLPSLSSGPSPSKCHGRADMACQTYGTPACGPSCNDDSQCGTDAKCNGGTGLCSKSESTPWNLLGTAKPDGGSCSAGLFPVSTPTSTLCGTKCTLGVVPTCQWSGTGKAASACVFRPSNQGAGDLGFCGKLCDCTDECPGTVPCTALPSSWATETGRKGVCGGTGAELPCIGDAGAD